ncbi:MAG: 16S rRNA (guanine(527)-N(7))-methyltransferase RsmG [Sterolibacterium sp.]
MNDQRNELLHAGIEQLDLNLVEGTEEKLLGYLMLLSKWNRIYNLTAVRDEKAMISQHLLDSLAVLPHLTGDSFKIQTLADVGSGGGLPGIPLAIACPQLKVTLIESSHKKASFLQQAKIELGLPNVSVHCGRVEDFTPVGLFDAAITRAFSSLAEFVKHSAHLLVQGGRLIAMKGIYPQQEIAQLPINWQISQSISLAVPELSAQRNLVIIKKT